ncbi:MAG TPA: hypothetical protein VIX42_02735 [Edaphobacter sp.]
MRLLFRQVVLVMALLSVSLVAQSQSARIPMTHGTTFAGAQVMLPDDLRGRVGVLVLGFSKSSGEMCSGWGRRVAANYRETHEVMYYQMPVLASVPKLIRSMVVKSIRSSVPETEQTHFLPVFSDEAEWRKIARYANVDDAYVLVVDGDGRVRWQASGKATDAEFAALKEQVDALRTQALSSATK